MTNVKSSIDHIYIDDVIFYEYETEKSFTKTKLVESKYPEGYRVSVSPMHIDYIDRMPVVNGVVHHHENPISVAVSHRLWNAIIAEHHNNGCDCPVS